MWIDAPPGWWVARAVGAEQCPQPIDQRAFGMAFRQEYHRCQPKMITATANPGAKIAFWRSLPMLHGLLPLDKSQLGPDIIAGITLAALGIPEVMGYTKIIGTPVITGLYTLFLPVLAFAVFGSSRHLVVSADSATAAMVAASLAALSLTANTPRYIGLTSLIALVTAAILLLARSCGSAFWPISSPAPCSSAFSPESVFR